MNHPARCGSGRSVRANPSSISKRWVSMRRDARAALRFNVSHSSDLALIGVCRGHELGVDLERIKPISEADRIVASFFSPAERVEFAAIPDHVKALGVLSRLDPQGSGLEGIGNRAGRAGGPL